MGPDLRCSEESRPLQPGPAIERGRAAAEAGVPPAGRASYLFGDRENRLMKPPGKAAIVTAVVVVVILAVFGYRLVNATRTYTHRTDSATLPADDSALTDWLKSRPGVLSATVSRDGNTVVVVFVKAVFGSEPLPNIHAEDERFGYRGRGSFTSGFQSHW